MSPSSIPCPLECGATGWGKDIWLDTHTGRYEPACECCNDDGHLTFTVIRDRALEGYRVPAGIHPAWVVAIYEAAMKDPNFDAAVFAQDSGLEIPELQLSIAAE